MQQHIDQYLTAALCEALQVSRSGYHAWRIRPINADALRLSNAIAACHTSHKARVGAPSIHADLQALGFNTVLELKRANPERLRQQLRALIRNVQREEAAQKPPKSSRELFKLIRKITEAATEYSNDNDSANYTPEHLHK